MVSENSHSAARKVLFVCLGNICRSPAAEAVFAGYVRGVDIATDSAGTSGWHVGDPPYGPMIQAGLRRGVGMAHLRARAFVAGDFGRFDLILVMDRANMAAVEALRPAGSATPVRLFLDYAPGHEESEVPDPYYSRDFEGALDLIDAAARGLMEALGEGRAP